MKKNSFQLSSCESKSTVKGFNGLQRGVLINTVKNMILPIDIADNNKLVKKNR